MTTPVVNTVSSNKAVFNNSKPATAPSTNKDEKVLGVKLDCKTIIFEEKFQCKAKELFDVFSKKELATAFTRGEAKLDFSKNGE